MKTIGILGGMSWESTITYYEVINQVVKRELGGLHSARCILYSVDFQEIETCQARGDWDQSAMILENAAASLEWAGVDFILIATNTMHKVAEQIGSCLAVPILHIAEVTADVLLEKGIKTVALLGTRYTMEQDFYKERLIKRGISVLIPEEEERKTVHDIIYQELCKGILQEESKQSYLAIMRRLQQKGAEGIILGCTEIGLLVKQEDTEIPLFDTARIHAERAALYALAEEKKKETISAEEL